MKKGVLIFLLGGAAAIAALAVYGIRHIDEFILDDDDDFLDDDDEGFYDDEVADDYDDDDDDDDDVACHGNCEECDLCSNSAKDAVPDVSGISAGLEA